MDFVTTTTASSSPLLVLNNREPDDDDDPVEMAESFFERGFFPEGAAILNNASVTLLAAGNLTAGLLLIYELCLLCEEHNDKSVPASIESAARQQLERLRLEVATKSEEAQEEVAALEFQGDVLLTQRVVHEALDAFEDCLNMHRGLCATPAVDITLRLLNKIALALHRMDDQESAKVRLEEALALRGSDEGRHSTYEKLWKVYGNLGMLDQAEGALMELVAMECPLPCQHKRDLGEYLHRIGKVDRALEVLDTLEQTAIILAMKARALCDKEREEDALRVLMAARESSSRNEESQLVVGQVYRRLLRPEEAIAVFDSITPATERSLHGKGLSLVAMRKFDDALVVLMDARALATATDDQYGVELEIVDDIGAVYHALGDEERALQYYLVAHGDDEEDEDGDDE